MDDALASFLDNLYRTGRKHDAPLEDRLLRLRNMTPEAAGLIAQLIRTQRSTHVLEIGTSNGYSAIWFADAVRAMGGRLTTVELDGDRASMALQNIEAAGVADLVTVVHADGGEVLRTSADGSVDLLVLDAERPAYQDYCAHIRRVLSPAGLIAVDNAVSHRDQLAAFRELLDHAGDFAVHVCQVGDGVLTAVRMAPAGS